MTKSTGDTFFTLLPDIYHISTKEPDEPWRQIVYRWTLVSSPRPTILICVIFIIVAKFLGPILMSQRPPFKIKPLIIAYNFTMVIVNMYIFYTYWTLGWRRYPSWQCAPFDRSVSGVAMKVNSISHLYFLTKYIDLLDTMFFVLTKKFDHITYLHLIHHSSMPLYCYFGMRLGPNGQGTLGTMFNSFVHIVMYLYYGLSCLGPSVKPFLWWKKYLTQFQVLQFIAIFIHTANGYLRLNCGYPPQSFYIYTIITSSFTVLFLNFYIKSYLKKGGKKQIDSPNGHISLKNGGTTYDMNNNKNK